MNRLKISRTSKTHLSSLPTFKSDRPKSDPSEPEVSKEDVVLEESSLGDVFQNIFGEEGQEVQPHEISNAASKPHVRQDDEPEHLFKEDEPPKREYTGQKVDEGVNASKATEVESADLDDLIALVMDAPADDEPKPSSPKRSASTPTKDEENDADFGDALSLIRGDDYEPPADDKPAGRDEADDRRSGTSDDRSRRPLSGETSTRKPMGGGTTTTTRTSYSSKFVPNIPESFYKDLESRLEDLIFKFECLDNEYAALQKISHNTSVETLEIKKIFTREFEY